MSNYYIMVDVAINTISAKKFFSGCSFLRACESARAHAQPLRGLRDPFAELKWRGANWPDRLSCDLS